jgi:hypothetical protein
MPLMEKKLEIQQGAEGFVAFCTGNALPFSFLAGQQQLAQTVIREPSMAGTHYRYTFETHAQHAPYILQFVWADLPADLAELDEAQDYEILLHYCYAEERYQAEAIGINFSCSEGQMSLPTGKRYLIAKSEPLDHSVPAPKDGVAPFRGYALLRNGTEVIIFVTRGPAANWTVDSLTAKARRIVFSTFFPHPGPDEPVLVPGWGLPAS